MFLLTLWIRRDYDFGGGESGVPLRLLLLCKNALDFFHEAGAPNTETRTNISPHGPILRDSLSKSGFVSLSAEKSVLKLQVHGVQSSCHRHHEHLKPDFVHIIQRFNTVCVV